MNSFFMLFSFLVKCMGRMYCTAEDYVVQPALALQSMPVHPSCPSFFTIKGALLMLYSQRWLCNVSKASFFFTKGALLTLHGQCWLCNISKTCQCIITPIFFFIKGGKRWWFWGPHCISHLIHHYISSISCHLPNSSTKGSQAHTLFIISLYSGYR